MSSNRSVSLSSAGKEIKSNHEENLNTTGNHLNLRSTSISVGFFNHGENSNFINTSGSTNDDNDKGEEDDDNDEEEEEIPSSKDIDIVGAISTLNLDDDESSSSNLIYGSLTPQASFPKSNHSSNTWNHLTQLAPPPQQQQQLQGNSSQSTNGGRGNGNGNGVFVKPFELPETKEDANIKQTTNGLNLPLFNKILDSDNNNNSSSNNNNNNNESRNEINKFVNSAIPFIPINYNNSNIGFPPPPGSAPIPPSPIPIPVNTSSTTNTTTGHGQGIVPNLGNLPPPPPHPSMGVPPFSPFSPGPPGPPPSFYPNYVASPPGEFQNFENTNHYIPPNRNNSNPSTNGPPPPPPQQQYHQPPGPQHHQMWSPVPNQRIPYQQGIIQPHQQVLSPQQHQNSIPIQQNNLYPMQQNHHHHHQQHQHPQHQYQQQRYRNYNHGMMNVHRKNMRRNRGEIGGNGNGSGHYIDDANKYINAKVEDFKGSILTVINLQNGSRWLQHMLENSNNNNDDDGNDGDEHEKVSDLIFNEIKDVVDDVMCNSFGNYTYQLLIDKLNKEQRLILLKNSINQLLKICLDSHGTRAFQKLIDIIDTNEDIEIIIQGISPHIITLSRDLNGNHVVQKILTKFTPIQNQFIIDIICENLLIISTNRHGCLVVVQCLIIGSIEQKNQLNLKICQFFKNLAFDQYGNYIVQKLIDINELTNDLIIQYLLDLSIHKFGSNVIEKALRNSNLNNELINYLINNKSSNDFNYLINDKYGNYVIQTTLDVANIEQFENLKIILLPLLPNIKNTPHGRRILNKLQ